MSPGKKRAFALGAAAALATTAIAGPVVAQNDSIDDILISAPGEYAPEQGTPGGTVVIADWQIPDQMNPYYISAFANGQVAVSAFDALWDVTDEGKYFPQLAATIPTIDNGGVRIDAEPTAECPNVRPGFEDLPGFEMDLELKPGLLWSDGEALDMDDVKYTVDWVLDPDNVGLYAGTDGYNLIDSWDISEDKLKATIHFCSGYTGYLGLFAGGNAAPPLPEHYMSQIPVAEAASLSYPVGPAIVDAPVNGPYKFASASSASIEMVRNDNWVSPSTGDPAYLDRVIYRFFDGSKDAMIAAFLAGEIDVATDLQQGDYVTIAGVDPSIGVAAIKPAWQYEHFDMNQSGGGPGMGHPALTDPNVRFALAHAINKPELYEVAFPGAPFPEEEPCSPVPSGLYYRTTEGLDCIEYDPELSVQLLDEAGWVDSDGDGVRDKDGVPLSLLHCTTGAGYRVASGDYLASSFRDIGVELINTAAPEVIFAGWNEAAPDAECNLTHGNHDTTEFAWVSSFNLYGNTYTVYHSSYIPSEENGGAGANYARLRSDRMDQALDDLFGAVDQAEAAELAKTIQQILTEEQSEVVLYYRSEVRGLNPKLKNFLQNPGTASDMWNVGDWYLES
jgi:peptide/nickel transport system substrate-binding protein